MKLFIRDILLFISLVLAIVSLAKWVSPFYWGYPDLGQKIEYFIEHEDEFDSFYIGSSGIYRQVKPEVVDSIAGSKSFNLGADAMFFLESHFILDQVLKKSNKKRWKIYTSENKVHPINQHNLHTVRNKYFMDFKRLKMGVNHFWNQKNYQQVIWHFKAYVENLLGIGEIKGLAFYWLQKSKEIDPILIDQRGFWAMDQEYGEKNSLASKPNAKSDMTEQEIHDFSFKIVDNSKTMVQLYNLPEEHQYHIIPWSLLLGTAFMYDKGHFNHEGARIYSEKIGQAISEFQ